MVKFFTTKIVRESISAYCKRDENGYKNCKQDIVDFFKDKSIDTIFNLPRLLNASEGFALIKSRIPNSTYNKGTNGCYRMYYYVDKSSQSVYFIGFYPKTGKHGREDLTATETKIHIKAFAAEKAAGSLIEHDINNALCEI